MQIAHEWKTSCLFWGKKTLDLSVSKKDALFWGLCTCNSFCRWMLRNLIASNCQRFSTQLSVPRRNTERSSASEKKSCAFKEIDIASVSCSYYPQYTTADTDIDVVWIRFLTPEWLVCIILHADIGFCLLEAEKTKAWNLKLEDLSTFPSFGLFCQKST